MAPLCVTILRLTCVCGHGGDGVDVRLADEGEVPDLGPGARPGQKSREAIRHGTRLRYSK